MNIQVSLITSCYRGLRYLADFFENVAGQTVFPVMEVIFIHNQPSNEELNIVSDFGHHYPAQLQHIVVDPVERIGASWNRGWKAAQGDYLAIWNVDDRRPPESIEVQARLLDQFPDCVLAYGDFIEVPEYGSKIGMTRNTPPFSKKIFSKSFPISGAFFMWKKEIAAKIGYFDEQLKIAADFDLSVRMALNGLKMCRANALLGYFTNAHEGLSNRKGGHLTWVEATLIQLRYAIYDKVRTEYLLEAQEYSVEAILNYGKWYPISDHVPGYRQYIKDREYLWKISTIRNRLRLLLSKLGILRVIYWLQERFIRREI